MSKNLKKFIYSIRNLEVDDQSKALKNEINNWMVGHEQVDDLLIVCVKL